MLTFSFHFCPPHRVYTAIDLKPVLVAIAPHTQGIFCQSGRSACLLSLTFQGECKIDFQM